MTTKKAAAKAASKPATAPAKRDPLPHLQAWHRAQQQIDTIDAQTGPDAILSARDAERLADQRADLVRAQAAAVEALA